MRIVQPEWRGMRIVCDEKMDWLGISNPENWPLTMAAIEELQKSMKSLVLCVLSSNYESEMVDKVKELLRHRLPASTLRTVIAGSGFLPENFMAVCQDAYNEGFKRIFIQAATMAFSETRYHDLLACIEKVRQVLPEIELTIFPPTQFYEKCGINPSRIIAMQGPFDKAFNLWCINRFKVTCMLTKESGDRGGFSDKVKACRETGCILVVLRRPVIGPVTVCSSSECCLEMLNTMECRKKTYH